MQHLDWIANIVYDLNQEILDLMNEEDQAAVQKAMEFTIEMQTNGDAVLIKFLGHYVWHSEDDERQEIDEDIHENLDVFLRREINKLMKTIKKIKL
jgi:hypothetical protein